MTTNDVHVPFNKTIELNCASGGRPRPTTIWYKDDVPLNTSVTKYTLSAGSLKIFRTVLVDSGTYKCVVSNCHDSITRTFNLDVDNSILKVYEHIRKLDNSIFVSKIVIVFMDLFLAVVISYINIKVIRAAYIQNNRRLQLELELEELRAEQSLAGEGWVHSLYPDREPTLDRIQLLRAMRNRCQAVTGLRLSLVSGTRDRIESRKRTSGEPFTALLWQLETPSGHQLGLLSHQS